MTALVLGLALLSTAVAQVSYKTYVAVRRETGVLFLALGLFGLAQIGFFVSLTTLDVGRVYMSTGLIHVMVLILSRFVLKESITIDHWIAVALITLGLVLYA